MVLIVGAVYVFGRHQGGSNNWGQVKKLNPMGVDAGDYFGSSVGISADTLVVGAYGHHSCGTDCGAAYVFGWNEEGSNGWGQVKKLNPGKVWDYFGVSVSVSGDTVLVGSRGEDSCGSDCGAAYVFGRNHGEPINDWGTSEEADSKCWKCWG